MIYNLVLSRGWLNFVFIFGAKKHYILFYFLAFFSDDKEVHIFFLFGTKDGQKRTENKASARRISISDNFSNLYSLLIFDWLAQYSARRECGQMAVSGIQNQTVQL